MNDTDLSLAQEDHLRALLHRAVDDQPVHTPATPPVATSTPSATPAATSNRGRWLAAAGLLVVAALGATWWLTSDGDRIDAGPADATTVDTIVVQQAGIWRLPTEDSGVELVEAYESPIGGLRPQLAVDRIDDPQRWLMVVPAGYPISEHLDASAPVPVGPDGATAALLQPEEPDGSTWLEVTGDGSTGYLTMAYRGLEDAQVLSIANDLVARIGNLTDSTRVEDVLGSFVPPDGLVPTWDAEHIGIGPIEELGPITTLGLYVTSDETGESDIAITVRATGLAPTVAALELQIQSEAGRLLSTANGLPRSPAVTPRPDLGPGVWANGDPGTSAATLMVITDDGVTINAVPAVWADELEPGDGAAAPGEPLTIDQQLGLINSLRAMSEDELRAELDRREVQIWGMDNQPPPSSRFGTGDDDPGAVTTTTTFGPGD